MRRRSNGDDRLRDLERRAARGDFDAYVASQTERQRRGLPFTPYYVDPTNGSFSVSRYAFGNGVHAHVLRFADPRPYEVEITAWTDGGEDADGLRAHRWAPVGVWVGQGSYEAQFRAPDVASGMVEAALHNLATLNLGQRRENPDFETSPADRAREEEASRRASNLEHLLKFQAAMAPDPREWELLEVADAGPQSRERCVCGHPIRNLYMLQRARDRKKIQVGSVCIESTVPYLQAHGAGDLAAALQRALAAQEQLAKDVAKRKRAAAGDAEVAALTEDWEVLQLWIEAAYHHEEELAARRRYEYGYGYHAQIPDWLYALRAFRRERPRALSTPGRTASSMRNKLDGLYAQAIMTSPASHSVPLPSEPKLRASLRAILEKNVAYELDVEARRAAGTLHAWEQQAGDVIRLGRAQAALVRMG